MGKFHTLCSLVVALLINSASYGQLDSLRSRYSQAFLVQSNLYTGFEATLLPAYPEGHSYFLSDDWNLGTVTYDRITYTAIPLLYDLVRQRLITEYPANGSPMEMIMEKVSRFTLNNRLFVLKGGQNLPGTRFYEVLYSGPTEVLVFHSKTYQKRIIAGELVHEFDEQNTYYLAHNGVYFEVSGPRSLRKVLSDRKKELKQADVGGAWEARLVAWAKFYDTVK